MGLAAESTQLQSGGSHIDLTPCDLATVWPRGREWTEGKATTNAGMVEHVFASVTLELAACSFQVYNADKDQDGWGTITPSLCTKLK